MRVGATHVVNGTRVSRVVSRTSGQNANACRANTLFFAVQPAKVLAALEWLRVNNPLYRDVQINSDWLNDAAQDDADLWEALSAQPPLPVESGTNTGHGDANQENDCKLCMYSCVCARAVFHEVLGSKTGSNTINRTFPLHLPCVQ